MSLHSIRSNRVYRLPEQGVYDKTGGKKLGGAYKLPEQGVYDITGG